jgi:hypothetical protein
MQMQVKVKEYRGVVTVANLGIGMVILKRMQLAVMLVLLLVLRVVFVVLGGMTVVGFRELGVRRIWHVDMVDISCWGVCKRWLASGSDCGYGEIQIQDCPYYLL